MATFIVVDNVKNKGNQIGCRHVEGKNAGDPRSQA